MLSYCLRAFAGSPVSNPPRHQYQYGRTRRHLAKPRKRAYSCGQTRWLPNLRRMRDAFGLMDEGKKQGGLAGWIKAKRGAVIAAATFVSLYTIPVIRSEPPKNVRLEPAY